MKNEEKRFFSNPGSPNRPIYAPKVLENGSIEVEKVGEENFQDYIQSFRESCDINNIMARYSNGELDALSRRQGIFGDFTVVPKSYAELLQTLINAESYFNLLPVETKQKFDNDFHKFMSSSIDPDFSKLLGFDRPDPDQHKVDGIVDEVKE